nr:hydrogenase [Treponema sp.]
MNSIIEQPRFTCALGAQQTVLAIPGAFPIVHAGPGCASRLFRFMSDECGNQGETYNGGGHITSTNTTETEVVFGGEKKLHETVESALKILDGDLFVILSGCTTGIIGDDIDSIASEFRDEGYPVIAAETSGFKGNNYFGHDLVLKSIINQFVGQVRPNVKKGLVNVFSVVPNQDPFWRGDLEEIKRILTGIGLEVQILFGNESAGISEWKNIPNAEFNLLLSPWVGKETVELLKEKYGTPYLHYPILPVGGAATGKFLREVGKFARLDSEIVEAFIKKEEKRFYNYFGGLADFITYSHGKLPFDLYTVGDCEYAFGVIDFLVNELGFTHRKTFITDAPQSDAARKNIAENAARIVPATKDLLVFEDDGGKITRQLYDSIDSSRKCVIFGSTWEEIVADRSENYSVLFSMPLSRDVILGKSFAGYNGGLRLVEELYSGMFKSKKLEKAV